MDDGIGRELAPTGVLRAGINTGNFLLVTGRDADGAPTGVAPDLARHIGARLGVPVRLVPFARAGELADAAGTDVWDVALIGAEPQRAAMIAFSAAYAEIGATYLVPAGSGLRTVAEVDRAGVRIAVAEASAYDLWLTRHIAHATLLRAVSIPGSFRRFVDEGLEAMAGLRPGLLADAAGLPGSRVLEGNFTAVQQAVGVERGRPAAAAFVAALVAEATRSGLVAGLIERHGVRGLTVAPVGGGG